MLLSRILGRPSALAGVVLAVALSLSSCGFDYATDRIYTPAQGANQRDASVDVLGAVIVAAQPDSGTFIATFVNGSSSEAASVESIIGNDQDQGVTAPDFKTLKLDPNALVNLATDGGPKVTGTFDIGNFVPMTIMFGDGTQVSIDVPVVPNCEEWSGLDGTGGDCRDVGTPADE
jgi:hypothetical protein